jgi:hypothetical protein
VKPLATTFAFFIILAVVFQLFFRYEYLAVATVGVVRIDRLTRTVCVAWPPNGTYSYAYCDRGGSK